MLDMTTIAFATKNIVRHKRRSAICLIAVAFGVVALLIARGFIDWVLWAHRETTIKSQLGHLQIARKHFQEDGASNPYGFFIPPGIKIRDALVAMPEVKAVGARIHFSGLIARGETTTSFIAEGVEPEPERAITASLQIVSGQNLSESDVNGIILGEGLASNLGAKINDKVVLIGKTATGGVNAAECTVRGTFRTITKAYDDSALRVPIQIAHRLMRNDGVHLWVVLLRATEETEAAYIKARRLIAGLPDLEVTPWYQLADFYTKTATLLSRQVTVVQLIVAVIVGLSILNSMTMAIMERTGDIGTSMALGASRSVVLAQFIVEGGLIGLFGGLLGVAIALPLAQVISAIGIPMPPPPGQSWGYVGQVRIAPSLGIEAVALVFVTALVAAAFPAWKASRLNIVDALRKNR
jgi:putative ABC transport system permease protein